MDALFAEVDRFAAREVARRAERPERPMDAGALAEILARADAIGLAGADDEPSGLGLWEDDAARSVAVLARLGRVNAAVAYALHQRALGRSIVRALGLRGQPGPVVVVPWGTFGIGREALARLLAGADLDGADRALLADVYAPTGTRIVTGDDRFAAMLLPVVDRGVGFAVVPRDALRIVAAPGAHGLDELVTARVTPVTPITPIGAARTIACAHETLAFALAAESLAHVAIALGAVASGHALARRYAATRRQGGAPIDRHAAVRLLLARGRTVLDTVEASLARAAACPPGPAQAIAAFAMRSEAHPLLSAAANDALQTFGGLGYMRDTGLEKIVRDTNHLRVLGGAPGELALVVAEWERLHG